MRTAVIILSILTILACVWGLIISDAPASDFFEVQDLNMTYQYFNKPNVAPYFTTSSQKERLTLRMDTTADKLIFFNNRIHATTDATQYRMIGWEFELGTFLTKQLSLQYIHHSQHVLDAFRGQWPFEDSIAVRFYFIKSKNSDSIF